MIYLLFSVATAQKVPFNVSVDKNSPFHTIGITGQDKENVYAGFGQDASIGEYFFLLGFTSKDLSSSIVNCYKFTNLGVKDNTLVVKMREYTVDVALNYRSLFKENGKVSSTGSFACISSEVYKETLNETVYMPIGKPISLLDHLVGHTMTITVNSLMEVTGTVK